MLRSNASGNRSFRGSTDSDVPSYWYFGLIQASRRKGEKYDDRSEPRQTGEIAVQFHWVDKLRGVESTQVFRHDSNFCVISNCCNGTYAYDRQS
jgi:hypothetical protein